MTTISEIVEKKVPEYENIEGPFTDPFNGLEYYTGELDGMKVKFNIKAVEYGKVRMVRE